MKSEMLVAGPGATKTPPIRQDAVRGIILMVTSGMLYSSSDAISKFLGSSLPSVEIAWLRWLGFLVIVTPVILGSQFRVLRSLAPGVQIIRSVCLVGSSLFFIMGLRYLPMADAITINFVSPIIVTALSIIFLAEKVGIRRWAAVFVGLIGVIIVIRPGSGNFGATALLPIASASCWALAIVATRKLASLDGPWTALSYMSVVGVVMLSALMPFNFVPPTWSELGLVALMTAAAGVAQFLTIAAFSRAEASVLAPFSYIQLIWATTYGYLLFQNVPDFWTAVGAAVIIASGLYTAHRERVRAREARAALVTAEPTIGQSIP